MNKTLSIELRNYISEVSRLGDILEIFGEENNISPVVVNKFNLALDEIVTNIISYGFKDNDEHVIKINLLNDGRYLNAIIEDDAKEFNPLEIPDADTSLSLEEKEIGGLGLHLVKKLMDSVDYKFTDGKNILTLKKKLI